MVVIYYLNESIEAYKIQKHRTYYATKYSFGIRPMYICHLFCCCSLDCLSKMRKVTYIFQGITHQNDPNKASMMLYGFKTIHSMILISIVAQKNIVFLHLLPKNEIFNRKWPYLQDFSKNRHLDCKFFFLARNNGPSA